MEQKNGGSTPERRWLRRNMFLIAFGIGMFLLLLRLDDVWGAILWVLQAATPLFLGVAIAFAINIPMKFFERHICRGWEENSKIKRAMRRPLCMLLAYAAVFLVLGGLIWLVLPKVIESVTQLATNFSGYVNSFQTWMDGLLSSYQVEPGEVSFLSKMWEDLVTFLQQVLTEAVPGIISFTVDFTTGLFQLLVSLMLAGFMLYNKEKLLSQLTRLSQAVLGRKKTRSIAEVCTMANLVFSRFILGQITEALILGLICFLCMQVFGMPYALLISTVIAITALIPIIGPIIGTVPCAIILLVIEPVQAVWFVVFIIVLQQLEGNLLYPRVVGNAIGLSGLWVLSSILVGGRLFGVWGMLLGVPTVAVAYRLVARWVRIRERRAASSQDLE